MIERYKHNQMNTSIPLSACFRSFHLKIRVILSKKKGTLRGKKKKKMEKRNLASKESGADFLAHNLTLKTPLVYAFARLKESSGVADFLYPMDYSLTFICFDCWCKMCGFVPNPFRGQKWNTGARNGPTGSVQFCRKCAGSVFFSQKKCE
jgi:hypothetical protein